MKKSNVALLCIVMMLLTAVGTFFVSNLLQLRIGDKVLMSRTDLEYYQSLDKRYSKVEELKGYIDQYFYKDVSGVDFEDGLLKGLFASLEDPYSVYMNSMDYENFNISTTGEYGGIGIVVSPNENGYIEVVSPIEDTPAEKAGVKSGDIILAVDEKDVNVEMYEEAVSMIRGKPGEAVRLTIRRAGVTELMEFEIVREEIKVQVVKTEVLEDQIGYLRLTSFDEDAYKEFKSELNALLAQNITGLIIDLRGNPGGSLSECTQIADYLLGEQVIVYMEDRAGEKTYYRSDKEKVDLPMAVLVDGGSASASEILTGAVQDSESGVVIGTQTFGKGLVQSVIELRDNTAFKLTTSQYFTPDGTNIHSVGIEPDIVIEPVEDETQDVQLEKAIDVIKASVQTTENASIQEASN
ncbi:S41 family peptidase [Acidaminobacter hydrogenoformans]|uniref:Carboxyl-terminal processing protease n=1 Tax=Acidaminobacter hydrogenoformans DSM 2784 TaxID=1120920 RepID=A0A1G5S5F2_9FIRM|nr:S41 family peptidase [Acidaminobacter hydrogenoformans]SCZ80759.1 carboxyl-terminal processing protease [Acidaminobacter hydrogenoformans DSM 2784]